MFAYFYKLIITLTLQKPVLFLALIAFILFGFTSPATWTKYVSKQGHFTIEFPGHPTENNVIDTADKKKPVTIHYVTYFPTDTEGYMADWIDISKKYPKEKTLKQILEESRDGALQSIKATFSATTATYLGKDPYIEFSFTSNEFAGKGRIYVINMFQYSIITLFPITSGISADADKFIKSFKHLQ